MLIKRTGDPDYPKHLKCLILGEPKAGKTSLASTFPNVVIADVEGGLMSVAHKNVPYVDVDSTQKLEQLLMILGNDQLRAQAAAALDLPVIESVAIDTVDALQQLLKKERMAAERRSSFQRDDWSWLLETLTEILRGFLDLPLHVIFNVHVTHTFDDESRMIYAPALQGAIQDRIAGMVGFSMLMSRSVERDPQGNHYTRYSLLTEGDTRHPYLGNRAAGRLPREIEPEFKLIHEAVYAGFQMDEGSDEDEGTGFDLPLQTTSDEQSAAPGPLIPDPSPDPAQSPSQPDGKPQVNNDDDDPITVNAVSHVQSAYRELELELPGDVETWTLGKARMVVEWINACKHEWQTGKTDEQTFKTELTSGLLGMEALEDQLEGSVDEVISGTIKKVQKWVGNDRERAQQAFDAERAKGSAGRSTLRLWLADRLGIVDETLDEARQDDPEPEPVSPTVTDVPSVNEEEGDATDVDIDPPFDRDPQAAEDTQADVLREAEKRLKQELGAKEVQGDPAPSRAIPFDDDGPCEECGQPVDDPDIAILAKGRLGKRLCVEDYMKLK